MTTATRFGTAARRLATVTSIVRTRSDDSLRRERHGVSQVVLEQRFENCVRRLELVVDELEKSIA